MDSPPKPPAPPPPLSPMTLPPPPKSARLDSPADDAAAPQNDLSSSIVDDGDLIEKEWVTKAKQIVEKNRDDPYKQSEELTVLKANYMKKHFGKDIKLSK